MPLVGPRNVYDDCKKAMAAYACTFYIRKCNKDWSWSYPCQKQCLDVFEFCQYSTGIIGCTDTNERCSCDVSCPFDWSTIVDPAKTIGQIALIVLGVICILAVIVLSFVIIAGVFVGVIACISIVSNLLLQSVTKKFRRPVQSEITLPSMDLKTETPIELVPLSSNPISNSTDMSPPSLLRRHQNLRNQTPLKSNLSLMRWKSRWQT